MLSGDLSEKTSAEILERFAELRRRGQLLGMQKLRELNIGPKQALMVCKLSQAGELTMIELARATTTDPAALGKAIQSLVARGWVAQKVDRKDARKKVLRLTSRGTRLSEKLHVWFVDHADHIFGFLNTSERSQLWSLISRAIERLGPPSTPGLKTSIRTRRNPGEKAPTGSCYSLAALEEAQDCGESMMEG
jgi:DNA-binding MarR family transcriptional regulator